MRFVHIGRSLLFLALPCTLAAAEDPHAAPQEPGSELRDGFTFNSTRKDGKIEWKVAGSSATFLSPETIELKNVRAIFFSDDGTNTVATTDKAVLDKETRRLKTDEFVTIATENSVTTGTGMDWDHERKRGALRKDVKVIFTGTGGKGAIR